MNEYLSEFKTCNIKSKGVKALVFKAYFKMEGEQPDTKKVPFSSLVTGESLIAFTFQNTKVGLT